MAGATLTRLARLPGAVSVRALAEFNRESETTEEDEGGRHERHLSQFFVSEYREHDGILLYEWLLEHAKKSGLHGGTAMRAEQALGGTGYCTKKLSSSLR